MKKLLFFIGLAAPLVSFSQAQLVINGTTPVYIVENGGTKTTPIYIDINNPAPSGIPTPTGTKGYIVSESEWNVVKWDIGTTASGSYTVPFGQSSSLTYLPLSINITSPGSNNGSIVFSTYDGWDVYPAGPVASVADNKLYMPSDVLNMGPGSTNSSPTATDNSYNAIDRFYIVDAGGPNVTTLHTNTANNNKYTTAPTLGAPGITFNYITSGIHSEIESPNTIPIQGQSDLFVQRYNNTLTSGGKVWGDWGSSGGYASGGSVKTGLVTPTNFYRSWTVSNYNQPLPTDIISFSGVCDNGTALIQWTSATEVNNDYYTVKKTTDDSHFETVGTIPGAGNSISSNSYQITDNSPYPGVSYYMLYQTDFDGAMTLLKTIQFNGCDGGTSASTINAYNTSGYINVEINAPESGNYTISLLNMLGQTVIEENKAVELGYNEFRLNNDLSPGVYLINIRNSQVNYTKKLVIGVR